MQTPWASWKSGRRGPGIALAVVVGLVAVVLVCEAIGWPFLVKPVESRLAAVLDRRVAFGTDGDDRGVRIGLLGGVRVTAGRIEIGAPTWSEAPHMLLAEDAYLRLGYWDLFRAWRGQPLHVKKLEAGTLDIALERRADGQASWQFGEKAPAETTEKPQALPTFGELRVGDGHLAYADQVMPATLDARFALQDASGQSGTRLPGRAAGAASEAALGPGAVASGVAAAGSAASAAAPTVARAASGIVVRAGGRASKDRLAPTVTLAEGESGLVLRAVGTYRKDVLVDIDLRTAGVLRLLDDGAEAEAQPLRLEARIGKAELRFDGTTTDPLHFRGLKGRFDVKGPSLAAAGDPLGITLPSTPPFRTHGTIAKDRDVWNAVFEAAEIGTSRLNGAFTFDRRPKVPLLSGKLGGSRLVLADLAPSIGAPAPGSGAEPQVKGAGRVIPDKRFDLPSLRAMDANVMVDIAMFDPGTTLIEPLRPVKAHILLADGVLTIADFEGRTAQGSMLGYLQLDGRGDVARWKADLRAVGLDLERWLRLSRKEGAPPWVTGRLDALAKVNGQGRSAAEILGTLDGDIRAHMRNATISHLAIEAGGIDVAQALGMLVKGDESLRILCNVVDLDVKDGVAKPRVFVLNTRDSTVWVDGNVSFRTEGMDLKAVVAPKDFSPLSLRTPIHVKGTLGAPAVSVEMGRLAGKAGAAALLALLHPLAAIIPFVDPGAKEEAQKAAQQCQAVAASSGARAPAVRVPADVKVPGEAKAPEAKARVEAKAQ